MNLEKRKFLRKSQGQPGIFREFSIIFVEVKENKLFIQYIKLISCISFSLTIGMVVWKVVALIVGSTYEGLGPIFFTSFCKYVVWGLRGIVGVRE